MFSFLNLSPSAQARMRARSTGANKLRYKLFKKLKDERVSRFKRALSIEAISRGIVNQCVESVFERRSSRSVRVKSKGFIVPGKNKIWLGNLPKR